MMAIVLFFAYAATVPIANWMVCNIGYCSEHGPCLIPVGFGLMAPSGVIMIGTALVLRDCVQLVSGWRVGLLAIITGTAFSFIVSPPSLATASAAAFFISEFADFAIYSPLARRNLSFALMTSCIIGAIADSAIFLLIAFGSVELMSGQVVGKIWVAVIATPIIQAVRKQITKNGPHDSIGTSLQPPVPK